MKQPNKKQSLKRLKQLGKLYHDGDISDKTYDILDCCLRLDLGILSMEDIWHEFVDKLVE